MLKKKREKAFTEEIKLFQPKPLYTYQLCSTNFIQGKFAQRSHRNPSSYTSV